MSDSQDKLVARLLAEIEELKSQLKGDVPAFDAEQEANRVADTFSPTDQVDAEDVEHITQRVAAGQRASQQAAGRYAGSAELHGLDHGHDTAADLETDEQERETEVVEWQDPSNLEAPPARPGYVQRWVRASFRTGEDPGNLMRARREGWRPRLVSSVGKDYAPATIHHKTLGEVIAVEGLILCEMPIKVARQRYKFYQNLLAAQNEAIQRDVHRDERPGMPIIAERRSTVTRGRTPQQGD